MPGIDAAAFRALIYEKAAESRRDLPWRRTADPYAILVSEFMLQQTQVQRVMLKYGEFLSRFPDVSTLARAGLQDVLQVWQGLGYNRRAIALKRTAAAVEEKHGGELPRRLELLLELPGIGKSTAGAVLAFAYGIPEAFIETNIRRVFIHFFFQDRDEVKDSEILPACSQAARRLSRLRKSRCTPSSTQRSVARATSTQCASAGSTSVRATVWRARSAATRSVVPVRPNR